MEKRQKTKQTGDRMETTVESGDLSWMRRTLNGDVKIPVWDWGGLAAPCSYREGEGNERRQRNHMKGGGGKMRDSRLSFGAAS